MLDASELSEAVSIQERSYRLLLWTGEGIERGFLRFDTVHDYATQAEAAGAWIGEHFENLPPDARPERDTGPGLERFARFFSTYLTTSFEIVEEPGTVLRTLCGCYCPICTTLSRASHLRPKKLTSGNKRKAEETKRRFVVGLAQEKGIALDEEAVERVMSDEDLSRKAALMAYGYEIVRRCRGSSSGPPVLALWRQFAWTPQGSPRKDFELTADAILEAERDLTAAIGTSG